MLNMFHVNMTRRCLTYVLKREETSLTSIDTDTFCALQFICFHSLIFSDIVRFKASNFSSNPHSLHLKFIQSGLSELHENFSTIS